MDEINKILENVKSDLSANAFKTVQYIREVNAMPSDCTTRLNAPEITNLEVNMHKLKVGMS